MATLTRKSTRRSNHPTKNVSFEPTLHLFDDLFPSNSTCYHENTPSTFSTLPKSNKRDPKPSLSNGNQGSNQLILPDLPRNQSNDFPTLQTVLHQSQYPQPPPLLNGILLLDQMLTNSTNLSKERTQTVSPLTSNSGWYNLTSNYQTKASVV